MAIQVHSLPDLGFVRVSFDLVVPRNVNRMEGRRTEARNYGTPYWTAEYQTRYLDEKLFGRADAFIRKVLSRGGVFKAHDVFRPRPIEAGAKPLTWTPTVTAITGTNQISVSGVGNNFQFREGDYVGLKMSDLVVSLHSVSADALANGSGAVTLSVDPAIDPVFTAAAQVIFEKPYCLMQPMDWSSTKDLTTRSANWSAQEVFFYEISDGSP